MKKTVSYEGNIVELKKDIITSSKDTTFNKGEVCIISKIEINTNINILNSGIKIYFTNGKLIHQENVTNYSSWLKKHFKLSI